MIELYSRVMRFVKVLSILCLEEDAESMLCFYSHYRPRRDEKCHSHECYAEETETQL